MKRTKIIVYVAVGIVAAVIIGCIALAPSRKGEKPSAEKPTATSDISIYLPGITTPPSGPEADTPTSTDAPRVENATHEDVTDKKPAPSTPGAEDKVVLGVKDKDTVQTGPASGEDRNDEILKEKEENAPKEKEENKPAIVEDEKTGVTDGKGDAQITDEKTNVDDGNKNGPVYNPSIGGSNPFDNDTKTEIDDTPVEKYVGTGENRPGEGIHF